MALLHILLEDEGAIVYGADACSEANLYAMVVKRAVVDKHIAEIAMHVDAVHLTACNMDVFHIIEAGASPEAIKAAIFKLYAHAAIDIHQIPGMPRTSRNVTASDVSSLDIFKGYIIAPAPVEHRSFEACAKHCLRAGDNGEVGDGDTMAENLAKPYLCRSRALDANFTATECEMVLGENRIGSGELCS